MTNPLIGQCIYCRTLPTADDRLQDEHIFPLGIYGKRKLRKASCQACANKTSAFESKVLKHDLRGLRTAVGFPTRRKEERRKITTLPMEMISSTGETVDIDVPVSDYYPIIPFPAFKAPAYLTKEKYEGGVEMIGFHAVRPKRPVEEIAAKYGARQLSIWTLRYAEAWALMFAKIGYALAVGHYGLARLLQDDVYVLNAILGNSNDIGMWVGCDGKESFRCDEYQSSHAAGVQEVDGEVHARVKLFAWIKDVPEYLVVVGRLSK